MDTEWEFRPAENVVLWHGWPAPISATERLPKFNSDGTSEIVMIYNAAVKEWRIGWFYEGHPGVCDYIGSGEESVVEERWTHWLPLPPDPEGD